MIERPLSGSNRIPNLPQRAPNCNNRVKAITYRNNPIMRFPTWAFPRMKDSFFDPFLLPGDAEVSRKPGDSHTGVICFPKSTHHGRRGCKACDRGIASQIANLIYGGKLSPGFTSSCGRPGIRTFTTRMRSFTALSTKCHPITGIHNTTTPRAPPDPYVGPEDRKGQRGEGAFRLHLSSQLAKSDVPIKGWLQHGLPKEIQEKVS